MVVLIVVLAMDWTSDACVTMVDRSSLVCISAGHLVSGVH